MGWAEVDFSRRPRRLREEVPISYSHCAPRKTQGGCRGPCGCSGGQSTLEGNCPLWSCCGLYGSANPEHRRGRGPTGLGETPSVHGETTWLHVCAPPGPAPCLAHTRCSDNTTAPRTHASSQFHAMDSLCDLENASLLPSVKWGSQYSPWSVLKIKT